MKKPVHRSIKIVDIAKEPLKQLPYQTAATNGKGIAYKVLPIYWGEMVGLPKELDALVVTSDLQGVIDQEQKLLGEGLADTLAQIFETHFSDLNPAKVVVCLCGDLYVDPLKRGSSGNPLSVWQAFRSKFGVVAGIAGNHDVFSRDARAELDATAEIHFFSQAGKLHCGEMTIAALGGVIGRADKPNRMSEGDYLTHLRQLLRQNPAILLLHESPEVRLHRQPGNASIWNELQRASNLIVCCGHVHWDTAMVECDNGLQILNTDGRAFIFTKASLD